MTEPRTEISVMSSSLLLVVGVLLRVREYTRGYAGRARTSRPLNFRVVRDNRSPAMRTLPATQKPSSRISTLRAPSSDSLIRSVLPCSVR
jgi:hypothetical protein